MILFITYSKKISKFFYNFVRKTYKLSSIIWDHRRIKVVDLLFEGSSVMKLINSIFVDDCVGIFDICRSTEKPWLYQHRQFIMSPTRSFHSCWPGLWCSGRCQFAAWDRASRDGVANRHTARDLEWIVESERRDAACNLALRRCCTYRSGFCRNPTPGAPSLTANGTG